MSLEATLNEDGNKLIIKIDGDFDFRLHQDFCKCYKNIDPIPDLFVIDLESTTYVDSSALGMLLLLRDHAGSNKKIEIKKANHQVRKLLEIANFDKLFTIH